MSEYLADFLMIKKTKLYLRQDTEVDVKQKTGESRDMRDYSTSTIQLPQQIIL